MAGFALFDDSKAQDAMTKVATGARVLAEEDFSRLSGLRVGLLVNHTSRVEDDHLIDLMFASGKVTLAALFALVCVNPHGHGSRTGFGLLGNDNALFLGDFFGE